MPTLREELEERCKKLPAPPFFALLPDPQQHLTAVELARSTYIQSKKLFVVAEVAIDRCFEQPGIWFRAVDSRPSLFDAGPNQLYSYNPAKLPIWVNADWCMVYDDPSELFNLKVN